MQIISILVGTQPKDTMANRNREFLIHFKHPSLKVHFFRAFQIYNFVAVLRGSAATKENNKK